MVTRPLYMGELESRQTCDKVSAGLDLSHDSKLFPPFDLVRLHLLFQPLLFNALTISSVSDFMPPPQSFHKSDLVSEVRTCPSASRLLCVHVKRNTQRSHGTTFTSTHVHRIQPTQKKLEMKLNVLGIGVRIQRNFSQGFQCLKHVKLSRLCCDSVLGILKSEHRSLAVRRLDIKALTLQMHHKHSSCETCGHGIRSRDSR